MPTKNLLVLKKRATPIAVLYTIALLIVSLITLDLGGLDTIVPSYGDKIFHFLAYALLTILWYLAVKIEHQLPKFKTLILVACACIAFGTIIEVLQKVFTISRFYDTADILANVAGVFVMSVLIVIIKIPFVKKY